jgi:hypothetical protein
MVTQSIIFSVINFYYQVVIINITIISYEHNDIALLHLYTANKPHPAHGGSRPSVRGGPSTEPCKHLGPGRYVSVINDNH